MMSGYNVPEKMISDDPCLVYLILKSKSLAEEQEKTSWFNLYSAMTEDKIMRLYGILYREAYKLAEIENRYQQRMEEINNRYR